MMIYLGLGSNLGDRESHLRSAVASLRSGGISVTRSASVYLTEPWDHTPGQPWFFNTVVEAETDLAPLAILEQCLAIESAAGRVRREQNEPRIIDIDILFLDSLVIQTPELTVPHPRYVLRRFVLAPLAELAPSLVDPVLGRTTQQLLDASTDTTAIRLQGPPLF